MKTFDITIGVNAESIEAISEKLRVRFGFMFVPRYSDYLGGDYLLANDGLQEVFVHWNADGDDLAEVEHPECNIIVQVDSCVTSEIWRSWLRESGGVLIRENQYDR